MHLLGGDPRVADDDLGDLPEVAHRVVEGDAPLVDHPQVRAGPRQVAVHRVVHQPLVEREGRVAARKRQMEVPELTNAADRMRNEIGRDRVDHRIRRGRHLHVAGQGRERRLVGERDEIVVAAGLG